MAVTHKHAVGFKKGDSIVVEGSPCSVTSISTSRPGKHGHAKVRIEAVGIVDGKKRQMVSPGHDYIEVPLVDKRNGQILTVDGSTASMMDMESYETFDIEIPKELKSEIEEGKQVLYWVIMGEKILKQVRG